MRAPLGWWGRKGTHGEQVVPQPKMAEAQVAQVRQPSDFVGAEVEDFQRHRQVLDDADLVARQRDLLQVAKVREVLVDLVDHLERDKHHDLARVYDTWYNLSVVMRAHAPRHTEPFSSSSFLEFSAPSRRSLVKNSCMLVAL
jgi:hypothetical protein